MRQTGELIAQLARSGGQTANYTTPGHALKCDKRLAFALPLLAAAVACGLSCAILFGPVFAAVAAAAGMKSLLGKWVFSFALTAGAGAALYTLAHPGRRSDMAVLLALAPLAGVAALAAIEFTGGLRGFPGASWRTCLAAIGVFGAISFAAAIYAARQLAPVKLRRAGAMAGLFGGGLAACSYAPFCPEAGMMYLLVFYGGPIIALAAIGWLTGPRLLRW